MRDEAEIRDELARIERIYHRVRTMIDTKECCDPVAGTQLVAYIHELAMVEVMLKWVLGDTEQRLHKAIDQVERCVQLCERA